MTDHCPGIAPKSISNEIDNVSREPRERYVSLEGICRAVGVTILYVFGSRAREVQKWMAGLQRELTEGGSDIDIGVKVRRGLHFAVREKVLLALALEDFFDCSRVDLVVLDEADPFVAAEVIRGERLFALDTHIADEYDLYVLRRAGDLLPLERERSALILQQRP